MAAPSFALFALAYYVLAGLGVNLAYHRVLSHRSLHLPKWLERALVTIGLPAGTPVQWAGTHRYHHATADTALDPHSPVQRGFLYAHVGWYLRSGNPVLCFAYAAGGPARMLVDAWMRPRTNQEHNALAEDVSADRWYRFISRPWPYAVAMHLHAGISLWLARRWWGPPVFWESGSRWWRFTMRAMRLTAWRTCSDPSSRNNRTNHETAHGWAFSSPPDLFEERPRHRQPRLSCSALPVRAAEH